MTELNQEKSVARPTTGRAFLKQPFKLLPSLRTQLVFWSLVVGGLLLDLWSKSAVFAWLGRQQRNSIVIIDGFLQLVIAENTGAAFGIAAGQTRFLIMVSVVALMVIFVVFLFAGTEQKLMCVSLGLFAAGVCGNLWDRIFNDGRVRDFIDVVYWPGKHWPAFNAADSMLCIGVGLMIISSFFTRKSCRRHGRQHK